MDRPVTITFGERRASDVRGVVICCQGYRCSHWLAISAEPWADGVRLSDIEDRFVCKACGKRGGDAAAGLQLGQELVKAKE